MAREFGYEDEKNSHLKHLEGAEGRQIGVTADLSDHISPEVEINACQGVFYVASPVRDDPNMMPDENASRRGDPFSVEFLGLISKIKSLFKLSKGENEKRRAEICATSAVKPEFTVIEMPEKVIAKEKSPVTSNIKSFLKAKQKGRRRAVVNAHVSIKIPDQVTAIVRPPATSASKSNLQVALAMALAGGSVTMMLQVPGGVNDSGIAVMDHTIAFKILFISDIVAVHASLLVGITVAAMSQISSKVNYLICINLWVATVCFTMSFHAAAYVVVLPNLKLIVLVSVGIFGAGMVLLVAFTIFY